MKPFNLQEVIKERVNKEALYEWAKQSLPAIPKYEKPKVEKKIGWSMFIKSSVLMFKP